MSIEQIIAKHQSDIENCLRQLTSILSDEKQFDYYDSYSRSLLFKVTKMEYAQVFSAYRIVKIISENDIEITEELARIIGCAMVYCSMYLPMSEVTVEYSCHLNKIGNEILDELERKWEWGVDTE